MEPHVITVVFGGSWVFADTSLEFVGNTTSKVFLLYDSTTLQDLKRKVCTRFNVDSVLELQFSHLHPCKKLKAPLIVDCDTDLKEFLDISALDGVDYAVELCVSIQAQPLAIVDTADRESVKSVGLIEYDRGQNHMIVDTQMQTVRSDDMYDDNDIDCDADTWRRLHSSMRSRDKTIEDCKDDSSSMSSFNNTSSSTMYIGRTFESKKEMKDALRILSVTEIFGYRVTRSQPKYFRAHCVDTSCRWKLHVNTISQNCYEVSAYNGLHTCTWDVRTSNCRQAPSSVVASIIQPV